MGANLRRINLAKANLIGVDLNRADLSGTNLSGADLRSARLSDVNLSEADLSNAFMSKSILTGVDLTEADIREADFTGTDLTGAELHKTIATDANLSHAILRGADLTGAFLLRTNLNGADLGGSDLSEAYAMSADLRGASLLQTTLIGALLNSANLRGASIIGADLSWSNLKAAELSYADLENADFGNADLSGANLDSAQLGGANYEPRVAPQVENISGAYGLSLLRFHRSPSTILALRKSLSDGGFESQARAVNAAIRRHDPVPPETWLFDWTCEWGSNWRRPLLLLGLLCLVSTPIYWLAIHFGRRTGLYVVATGQRVATSRSKERLYRVAVVRSRRLPARERKVLGSQPSTYVRAWQRRAVSVLKAEVLAMGTAFLFSLMTVFNIGFHDFNFGRWIRMLQPREYDLRARGWMRTAAGVQSLLGLALVALSLLSYFGHPFA